MSQTELVKQSDLLNQLVLNRDTMEAVGRVETLWMYAPSHRVLGFVCKAGLLGGKKLAFKLSQVTALGDNGILTHSSPQETDAEKVRQLESVVNCEVWSESGEKIGKITDYIFNLRTGEIAQYLFVDSEWNGITGDVYQLFPTQVLSFGHRRVLIPDYVVNNLSIYREGVKQKLTKAKETLKEEYSQVVEEFQSLSQQAQSKTEQAKERFQNLTGQLKQRAQILSQKTRETIYSLNEQLQEETQNLAEQARGKSQTWLEQVREQSQTLGEQVEDGIQTLTVQAREILDSDEPEEPADFPYPPENDSEEDFFDALFSDVEAPNPKQPTPSPPPPSPPPSPPPIAPEEDSWENLPPVSLHNQPLDAVDDLSLEDDIWESAPEPSESFSSPTSEDKDSSGERSPEDDAWI
jgi:uncharacterized protein YrrD